MKCGIADVGSNTIRLSIYRWDCLLYTSDAADE